MARAQSLALALLLATAAAARDAGAEAKKPSSSGTELNGFELTSPQVAREKILSGGPPRDGIRSVDEPKLVDPSEVSWVAPETPVLGVAVGPDAHAYPVHLLEYHQIVNDVVGGVPIVATYDPLAGSPLAFRRKVEGQILSFGVSGLVYNSNFLLYDRETQSLWSQMLGKAITGPLAGKTLERVRIRQETFVSWFERYPDTTVLARPEPKKIDYRHSPFERYWVEDKIPFPVEAVDRSFHAKEVVVGVVAKGEVRAYLGSRVTTAGGVVQDTFAGRRILIEYSRDHSTFRWDIPDDIQVTEAYWFAWKAFHPNTEVWAPARPNGQLQ